MPASPTLVKMVKVRCAVCESDLAVPSVLPVCGDKTAAAANCTTKVHRRAGNEVVAVSGDTESVAEITVHPGWASARVSH